MAIVWITSAVLLLVITPVVVMLLNRVKRPVGEIRKQSDYLCLIGAPTLLKHLDAVDQLPKTRQLVGETGAGVARYGGALDQILG
jgi:hypothetical protein